MSKFLILFLTVFSSYAVSPLFAMPEIDISDDDQQITEQSVLSKYKRLASGTFTGKPLFFHRNSASIESVFDLSKQKESKPQVISISNAPVDEGYLSSVYGIRKDPIHGGRQMHRGIDIAASLGSEVKPLGLGEVVYAGYKAGYGNVIDIKHGRTVITRYAHLKAYLVDIGQKVDVNETIGLIGSTGRSTGPHLHLEVLFNNKHVNPQVYLANHFGTGARRYAKIKSKKTLAKADVKSLTKRDSALVLATTKASENEAVISTLAVGGSLPTDSFEDDKSLINTGSQIDYQDYVNSINGLYGFSAPESFNQ